MNIIRIKIFLSKYKYQILLGVILTVGAFLRFWNLVSQGFFYPDEGQYLLSASTLARVPAALWEIIFLPMSQWSEALKIFLPAGFFEFLNARPSFIVIDVIGMWILGVYEYTPAFVNAFFGVATIYLAYQIGRDNFKSVNVGLLAAALMAFSKFHVFYSRSGESHLASGFFLLLAIYFWLKADEVGARRKKYLIFSGFSFGILATTHYMNYMVMALAMMFGFIAMFRKDNRHRWQEFSWFVGSAIILPVFWLIVLWLKARLINSLGFFDSYISLTYIGDILENYHEIGRVGHYNIFEAFWVYPPQIARVDGWFFAALFGIAPLLLIFKNYRRNFTYLFFTTLTFYPIIFVALSPLPLLYTIATYFTAAIVIASFVAISLYKKFRTKTVKIAMVIIIAASISSMLVSSSKLVDMHMPHAEVAKFMREINAKPEEIIAFSWEPYQFLLQAPISSAGPETFKKGGFKYYISAPEDNWREMNTAPYSSYVRRHLKPLAEFKINYGGTFPELVNYMGIKSNDPKELRDMENHKIFSAVQVYDISGIDFSKIK